MFDVFVKIARAESPYRGENVPEPAAVHTFIEQAYRAWALWSWAPTEIQDADALCRILDRLPVGKRYSYTDERIEIKVSRTK